MSFLQVLIFLPVMHYSWGFSSVLITVVVKASQPWHKRHVCWEQTGRKTPLGFSNPDGSKGKTELHQLTGNPWNPDLFTTGAIPSISCGLDFNNVVFLKGQQKFSWSFICIQHLHTVLTASPIKNLKCTNKDSSYVACFYFFPNTFSCNSKIILFFCTQENINCTLRSIRRS